MIPSEKVDKVSSMQDADCLIRGITYIVCDPTGLTGEDLGVSLERYAHRKVTALFDMFGSCVYGKSLTYSYVVASLEDSIESVNRSSN